MCFLTQIQSFFFKRKLIGLCQANLTFFEFYTQFSKYAECSDFNDKAIKCYLLYAFLEELPHQLVSINLKDLNYQQLVQECQTQDNQLRATVSNACKPMSRS